MRLEEAPGADETEETDETAGAKAAAVSSPPPPPPVLPTAPLTVPPMPAPPPPATSLQCDHLFNILSTADPIAHFLSPLIQPSAVGPTLRSAVRADSIHSPTEPPPAAASAAAPSPPPPRQLAIARQLPSNAPLDEILNQTQVCDLTR